MMFRIAQIRKKIKRRESNLPIHIFKYVTVNTLSFIWPKMKSVDLFSSV